MRARQTADIVAGTFNARPPVAVAESLAPGGTYAGVLSDLEGYARHRRVALVGHEPAIGELAARLVGSRRPLAFKKGAVCRIDLDALPPSHPGTLRYFLTPAILRQLAK
jgi:phosphohistidine phosphatase